MGRTRGDAPVSANPFAKGAPAWRRQGWVGTILLPYCKKSPPPTGYTGHDGLWPDDEQVARWAAEGGNLGIRLPDGVIGIDVDWYKDDGQVSWGILLNECGPLPATWKSSARPQQPHSGIYLFRVPLGTKMHDRPGSLGGIEIIQFHHRYMNTWPSMHPEGGKYLLTSPDGKMGFGPPLIEELPELPEPWLKRLILPERAPGVAKTKVLTGTWTNAVTKIYAETLTALTGAGRHDSMRDGIVGLTRLDSQGHPGAREAMAQLGDQFIAAVTADGTRTPAEAQGELQRIHYGAEELVTTTPSYRPPYDDLKGQGKANGAAVTASPSSSPAQPAGRLVITKGSAVKYERARWVWQSRIPVGGTTLMPGGEGQGKSTFTCWLMARLTRGELPGEWSGRPADVVYIGLEDDLVTVMLPRLVAVGADLDRFNHIAIRDSGVFDLSRDVDELATSFAGHDVALVVLDPLDSHLGAADTHRKSDVQTAIGKLAQLAQQLRCGALGLAHLNKTADVKDLLNRTMGSKGFTTATRSVLGVGEHPQQPGERLCVLAKANMVNKDAVPAVRFRIETALLPSLDEDNLEPVDTSRAVFLGEEHGVNPNSILAVDDDTKTAMAEAIEFLESALANGRKLRKDLVRIGKQEGISDRTLDRAAKQLGVESWRDQVAGGPAWWSLPPSHVRRGASGGLGETPPSEGAPGPVRGVAPGSRQELPGLGETLVQPDHGGETPDPIRGLFE